MLGPFAAKAVTLTADSSENEIASLETQIRSAEKTLEDALTGNPAWAGLTAVKEGRVHYMDRKLYHFKPNNRWGIAYAELEALLYEK